MLIDDGKVKLRVVEAAPDRALAVVEVPGRISNRKGVSLPDTEIPVSAMTPKDRSDLDAALNEGVDWIAVSFVQPRRRRRRGEEDRPRPRAWCWPRSRSPRRSPGSTRSSRCRTPSWWRAAISASRCPLERVPGLQKRILPHGAPPRQARRGGDPDAGIDDHVAGADARRGVGRGPGRVRGRRCRDAVGRIGLGASSRSRPWPR